MSVDWMGLAIGAAIGCAYGFGFVRGVRHKQQSARRSDLVMREIAKDDPAAVRRIIRRCADQLASEIGVPDARTQVRWPPAGEDRNRANR